MYELSVVVESWSLVEEPNVMLLCNLDSISTKKKIFKRCSDTSRLVKGYLLRRRFLGVFANLTKHERKTHQKTTYYSGQLNRGKAGGRRLGGNLQLAFCASFFLSVGWKQTCGAPPTEVRKQWQDGVLFMGGYVSVVVMTLLAVVNPNKPVDQGTSREPNVVSKG